jgi:carboxymethylenebutenolidase
MTTRWENLSVQGKTMRSYLGVPSGAGPHPGVVIAMHGLGIDASMLDVVHRLNRAGYAAALPDLFHRQPEQLPDAMSRVKLLRDDEIVTDMNAAAALLKSQPGGASALGVTGFCMGGRVTYLMAAANAEMKAAAVFYGGGIMASWGGGPTPFERSKDIGCPLLGSFGINDTNPSPDDVKKIDAELTRLGKWHEFHMYQDAGHGFQNFASPERYAPRAAQASWGELIAFFDHFLKQRGKTK